MLILTRLPGERIVIGEGIIVEVVSVERNRVRLGIAADPSIPVNREEIHERIQREKRASD